MSSMSVINNAISTCCVIPMIHTGLQAREVEWPKSFKVIYHRDTCTVAPCLGHGKRALMEHVPFPLRRVRRIENHLSRHDNDDLIYETANPRARPVRVEKSFSPLH